MGSMTNLQEGSTQVLQQGTDLLKIWSVIQGFLYEYNYYNYYYPAMGRLYLVDLGTRDPTQGPGDPGIRPKDLGTQDPGPRDWRPGIRPKDLGTRDLTQGPEDPGPRIRPKDLGTRDPGTQIGMHCACTFFFFFFFLKVSAYSSGPQIA